MYLSDEHGHAGRVGFDADVAAGLDELSVDHGRRVERAPLGRFLKTRNGPSNNLRLVLCDDIAVTRVTVYSGRRLLKKTQRDGIQFRHRRGLGLNVESVAQLYIEWPCLELPLVLCDDIAVTRVTVYNGSTDLEWLAAPFDLVGVSFGLVLHAIGLDVDFDLSVYKKKTRLKYEFEFERDAPFRWDPRLRCRRLRPPGRPCWDTCAGRSSACCGTRTWRRMRCRKKKEYSTTKEAELKRKTKTNNRPASGAAELDHVAAGRTLAAVGLLAGLAHAALVPARTLVLLGAGRSVAVQLRHANSRSTREKRPASVP